MRSPRIRRGEPAPERQPSPARPVAAVHPANGLQRTFGNAALQRLRRGDFATLGMFGLDVDSWDAFEQRLDKIGVWPYLTMIYDRLLELPLSADVERAGALVIDRQREQLRRRRGGAAASRQQRRRSARVGFEFQMLDSEVEVLEAPEAEEPAEEEKDVGFVFDHGDLQEQHAKRLQAAETTIPAHLFGRTHGWYVVADGDNLEFVTTPMRSLAFLAATMSQLTAAAKVIAAAKPGATFRIGDTVVVVRRPGSRGQPQANPDIPLDALPALIAEAASGGALHKEQFGADEKFWSRGRTDKELAAMAQAAKGVRELDADAIAKVLGHEKPLAPSRVASARGLLQLLANACIHLEGFHTEVEKDMPLLSKTHLGRTWRSLAGEKPDRDRLAGLLASLYEPIVLKRRDAAISNVARSVIAGKDPVWGDARPVQSLADDPERTQVLVELRRAPVLPIEEWTRYALRTYDHFIADAARRFD